MDPFHPGLIPSLKGATSCCTDGGPIDLGTTSGWPLVNEATLDLYARTGVTLTEVRMGPASLESGEPGPEESLQRLEQVLTLAEARGIYVLVSLIDGWIVRHGLSYWGEGPDIFQHAPQPHHLAWIRQVVAVTARHPNAIVYDGNEIYVSRAWPVWVNGLIEEAKAAGAQFVCSNARLGLGDCQIEHGWRTANSNTIVAESDNENHSIEEWLALRRNSSGSLIYWRGPMSQADWVRLLEQQ